MPPGEIVAGTVDFQGKDLLKLSDEELRHVRGAQIGFVFQDPMTSFNPVHTIGRQLMEPLEIHLGMNKQQAWNRAVELLEMVQIPNACRPDERLSPPVFRRHASAGDDRHGAFLLAPSTDR